MLLMPERWDILLTSTKKYASVINALVVVTRRESDTSKIERLFIDTFCRRILSQGYGHVQTLQFRTSYKLARLLNGRFDTWSN